VTSRVLVSVRVNASPERAFRAFTEEIGAWWRPNALFATTPRAPGRLTFEEGRLVERLANGRVFEIGQVTVWAPGERLAFSWRQASFPPDLKTEVEVRFEAVGAETRVTVEHSGFDRVPADNVARHGFPDQALLARLADWWRVLLSAYSSAGDRGDG
jgi:uncharacterized protein YndB with AHSA1/START domain